MIPFEPVTALIYAGLQIGGAILKNKSDKKNAANQKKSILSDAMGLLEGAKAQDGEAQARDYNAVRSGQDASAFRDQYGEVVRRFRSEGDKEYGAQKAHFGASGIRISGGSAEDALKATVATQELDAATLEHEGEVKAIGSENDARIDRLGASRAREAAGFVRERAGRMIGLAGGLDKSTKNSKLANLLSATGNILQRVG